MFNTVFSCTIWYFNNLLYETLDVLCTVSKSNGTEEREQWLLKALQRNNTYNTTRSQPIPLYLEYTHYYPRFCY